METPVEPVVVARRSYVGLIWIVPLLALLVGIYVIHRELMSAGPRITISFVDGSGIVAGQTKLMYRGIHCGVVTALELKQDLSGVEVEVELLASAAPLAAADSRFWINRAEISLQGVRGLDTLLSGVTLSLDPGTGAPASRFRGLESPPLDASVQGTEFHLSASQRGGINVGTPVAFRGIAVGRVLAVELSAEARQVIFRVEVFAPYHHLVRDNTVFWNASGVDFDFGLFKGLQLRDGGVDALLQGGIAFATPDQPGEPAPAMTAFTLKDRVKDEWLDWAPEILLEEMAKVDPEQ